MTLACVIILSLWVFDLHERLDRVEKILEDKQL